MFCFRFPIFVNFFFSRTTIVNTNNNTNKNNKTNNNSIGCRFSKYHKIELDVIRLKLEGIKNNKIIAKELLLTL